MPLTLDGTNGVSAVQAGAVESGDLPAEAYQKNNILGTVSESSGTPTGAIIERGSNANGEFVKYADGTLICMGEYKSENSTSQNPDTNFPVAFFNNNYRVTMTPISNANRSVVILSNEKTTSRFKAQTWITESSVNASGNDGDYLAIGRWY